MKLLITGGFGYLGGRLAQHLAIQAGYKILLGSRQQAQTPQWLPQAEVVQTRWDLPSSLDQLCRGVDAIAHLARMNAQDCALDPVAALEFNALATARLLQAAVRHGVKRFIYLSTAHVYGSPLSGVIAEDTCPVSLHPYATSQRAGEDIIRSAHQRREIEGIVIRLSNSYGAPAHKDANCWMLLVNDLCRQAVTTGRMVLRSSGLHKRDFITLTDACSAIQHLAGLPAALLGNGLFNVGSGWAPTIFEMTERVALRMHAATGRRPELLCEANQDTSKLATLDYKIEKLIATGYGVRGNENVDQEIDKLIQFCLKQFSQCA